MRIFGIAACAIVLVAAPAAAQDYYQDDGYRDGDRYAPQAQGDDWREDDDRWDDRWDDDRPDEMYADRGFDPAAVRSEDEAVDACAIAAENQGRAYAASARVTDIADVARDSRGWVIDGTLEMRDWHRGGLSGEERFRCAVTFEGLRDVRIAGLDDDNGR